MLPREKKIRVDFRSRSRSCNKSLDKRAEKSQGRKKKECCSRVTENNNEAAKKGDRNNSRGRSKIAASTNQPSPSIPMQLTISRLLKTKDGLKNYKEQANTQSAKPAD